MLLSGAVVIWNFQLRLKNVSIFFRGGGRGATRFLFWRSRSLFLFLAIHFHYVVNRLADFPVGFVFFHRPLSNDAIKVEVVGTDISKSPPNIGSDGGQRNFLKNSGNSGF